MKEQIIEEIENTLITISKHPIMIEGLEHWSDVIAEELYNAGYRKQKEGEWISVEDRLPENSDQILIYLDNGNIEVGYYDTDDNKFHHILPMPRVTHWMPLPEPPKKKGGAE